MLTLKDLAVSYGPVAAVRGVNLGVGKGEIVALLGANGAGKSSILRAAMGLAPITAGRVTLSDVDITGHDPAAIVKRGMTLVPEGRRVFAHLTVLENLNIGAAATPSLCAKTGANCERMYELFPRLAERRSQLAGSLSGGEQQMLAIARALMAEPAMLLLDEPSLGLAPNIVDQIFDFLTAVNRQGLTILIVEQNADIALEVAGRALVVAQGRVVKEGTSAEVARADLASLYLGAGAAA